MKLIALCTCSVALTYAAYWYNGPGCVSLSAIAGCAMGLSLALLTERILRR